MNGLFISKKLFVSAITFSFLTLYFSYAYGATFDNYGIKFEYPNSWDLIDRTNDNGDITISFYDYGKFYGDSAALPILIIWVNSSELRLNTTTNELESVNAFERSQALTGDSKDENFKLVKENQTYNLGNYTGYGYEFIKPIFNNSYNIDVYLDNQNKDQKGDTIQFRYSDEQGRFPKTIKGLFNIFKTFEFTDRSLSTSPNLRVDAIKNECIGFSRLSISTYNTPLENIVVDFGNNKTTTIPSIHTWKTITLEIPEGANLDTVKVKGPNGIDIIKKYISMTKECELEE